MNYDAIMISASCARPTATGGILNHMISIGGFHKRCLHQRGRESAKCRLKQARERGESQKLFRHHLCELLPYLPPNPPSFLPVNLPRVRVSCKSYLRRVSGLPSSGTKANSLAPRLLPMHVFITDYTRYKFKYIWIILMLSIKGHDTFKVYGRRLVENPRKIRDSLLRGCVSYM